MKIAFIGLGIMGSRMAERLLADHEVTVFNRSPEKIRELQAKGARRATSAAEAAAEAEIVFTMLADPPAVRALALGEHGILEALPANALWVDASTGNPAFSREMARAAHQRNLRFLDAPVAGSRPHAESGELVFFVGGNPDDLEQARPCLDRLGKKIVHVGGQGQGMAMKMVVNHLLGTAMQAFAEGLHLGENLGIDQGTLFDVLLASPVTAPLIQYKRAKLEGHDYAPDFSLKWMHKDLQMVSESAYEHTTAMPLSAAARESYRMALQNGLGEQDFAAIYRWLQASPES